MLEVIQHEYFLYGVVTGFIVIPLLLFIIIYLIECLMDITDYHDNKKEFKEWLEKRKEMKD